MPHSFFLRLIAALMAAQVVPAARANATECPETPIRLRQGLIWIEVGVESREDLKFLFDTGAGSSFLDLDCAARLGLEFTGREVVEGLQGAVTAYRTPPVALRAGPVTMRKPVLAMDLRSISRRLGCRVDGVLGADFLCGRIVQIDCNAGRLRFPQSFPTGAAGKSLPLRFVNDAPCVPGALGDAGTGWLRIDTGCCDAVQWVEIANAVASGGRASFGFSDRSLRYRRDDLVLGALRIAGVRAGIHERVLFPGERGLIGNGLLARCTVTIDADGGRLVLSH